MDVFGLASIIVSLVLLIFLVYKGVHVVIAAPLAAIIIVFCNGLGYEGYSVTYMTGLGSFVTKQLPVFLWGGIFGQLFNRTGCAASIAQGISHLLRGKKEHAGVFTTILIVTVIGILLSYGGINSMVLMLLLMPMTLGLMKECGIPRYMAPGVLLSSIATVGMCLPGSPQIVNVTPSNFLSTSSMAGMIPGFIGGLVVIGLNLAFLTFSAKREIAKGNRFLPMEGEGEKQSSQKKEQLPHPVVALIPLVLVFVLFNVFKLYIGYSIMLGILCCIVMYFKRLSGVSGILETAKTALISTGILCLAGASLSGFGAVVSATAAFGQLSASLSTMDGPPLFVAMIAIMLVVGICGAGPAGIGTALPMFADTFAALGVNMSALHRVASFSATTLDTLPTNSGFIAASGLAQTTPAKAYKYVGVVTVINTTIGTIVVTALLTLFPALS